MDGKARMRNYVPPTLTSFDSASVREMLGPVETQYSATISESNCLPLSGIGDSVQDNWQFAIGADPTRVNIDVDVAMDNAGCANLTTCAVPPDTAAGPLDPKFAVYPPGVVPALGIFNGYYSAADCSAPDPGCPTKPANSCIVCDNANCSLAAAAANSCGSLDVTLTPGGVWTIAVAPQAPSFVPQSQGCYVLTVSALGAGATVAPVPSPWAPVNDDVTVTFLRGTVRR